MNSVPAGPGKKPTLLKGWAGLLAGLALILVFMFGIAPWVQKLDAVRPLAEYILDSGIDAQALFYTEVEETGDAETYMKDSMRYPPRYKPKVE